MREVNLKAYIAGLPAFTLALFCFWIYWEGVVLDLRLAAGAGMLALVLDAPSRPGVDTIQARARLGASSDTGSEGYRMADDYRFVFPAPENRRTKPDPGHAPPLDRPAEHPRG